MGRITGKNIRFIVHDKGNETMVVSRWLQVVSVLVGITQVTLRRKFQNEDGTVKTNIHYHGYDIYRCEEFKAKPKKGNLFIFGSDNDRIKIQKQCNFNIKRPQKRKY